MKQSATNKKDKQTDFEKVTVHIDKPRRHGKFPSAKYQFMSVDDYNKEHSRK